MERNHMPRQISLDDVVRPKALPPEGQQACAWSLYIDVVDWENMLAEGISDRMEWLRFQDARDKRRRKSGVATKRMRPENG